MKYKLTINNKKLLVKLRKYFAVGELFVVGEMAKKLRMQPKTLSHFVAVMRKQGSFKIVGETNVRLKTGNTTTRPVYRLTGKS